MPKSNAVTNPNLGLYLDRPIIDIPLGGLQDGLNFRIKQGKINNLNLGWSAFGSFTLNGPVVLVANLMLRSGVNNLIFGTLTDLYAYTTSGGGTVKYITPIYATGTVAVSGTAVTGSGTAWNTTPTGSLWKNAKVGDEISFGSATQNLPSATWYLIDAVGSDTSITLHTSAGTIGAGSTYTIRRKFTGAIKDLWQAETFVLAAPQNEDQIFLTNGVDNVMRWNGTDAQVSVMTGFGFSCKALVNFRNVMVYLNVTYGGVSKPTDIVTSDIGQPSNAGNATTGLGAELRVHGGTDAIITAKRIGDYLAIYSQRTITMAYFTGDDVLFVFRNAVAGKGPIGINAVAVFPDHHKFVGADMFYVFDGTTARYDGNQVWREILRTQDPTRIANISSIFDEQNGELVWSVPQTSDTGSGTVTSPPAVAFVEHYLENVGNQTPKPYSKRTYTFFSAGFYNRQAGLTWDQLTNAWNTYNFKWNDQFFAASFPLILVGDNSGKIWQLNGSQDANGAALPSFVKFGRRTMADGRARSLLTRVYPFVAQYSTPLKVTAHMADFAIGPSTIDATVSYDQSLPEGLFFAPIYRVGRYTEVEFGTAGPSQPWEISGYDTDSRQGGMR